MEEKRKEKKQKRFIVIIKIKTKKIWKKNLGTYPSKFNKTLTEIWVTPNENVLILYYKTKFLVF